MAQPPPQGASTNRSAKLDVFEGCARNALRWFLHVLTCSYMFLHVLGGFCMFLNVLTCLGRVLNVLGKKVVARFGGYFSYMY